MGDLHGIANAETDDDGTVIMGVLEHQARHLMLRCTSCRNMYLDARHCFKEAASTSVHVSHCSKSVERCKGGTDLSPRLDQE